MREQDKSRQPVDTEGELDFDDGGDMVHPRGKVTGAGRSDHAPNVGMSDRNGPSDPDTIRSDGRKE